MPPYDNNKNNNDMQEGAPEDQVPTMQERKAYMFQGVGCCYTGCDLNNIMLCSKADIKVCCVSHEHCLAANHDDLGIGMLPLKEADCCKLGFFCCTVGCHRPQARCTGVTQQWCMTQVMSFPFDKDYIEEPVCACCFFQCLPANGCMLEYPEARALQPILDCTTPVSQVITRS